VYSPLTYTGLYHRLMNKGAAPKATPEILDIGLGNVEKTGFFCYMSKKKSEGYQRKLRWLQERFSEGMRIKMLAPPERGFIEYIPGEHAWRAVHADGYLFIHCLWVVGKSKGKGFSTALLEACLADAREQGRKGVAMVTSEKVWLAGRRVLDKHGFECVDTAPPAFSLMVKRFGNSPVPSFAGDWEAKAQALGPDLTVIRSDQCPYIVDATAAALASAARAGVESRVIELQTRDDLLRLSPSPYGVFGLVLDGRLLSYYYQLEKDLVPLLGPAQPGTNPAGRGPGAETPTGRAAP
jgi:GNAT superfamily N-acetyltransferase